MEESFKDHIKDFFARRNEMTVWCWGIQKQKAPSAWRTGLEYDINDIT